jgi:LmbE family N-acetylglucosaminyl deacetylase
MVRMNRRSLLFGMGAALVAPAFSQDRKLRIIAFGAHPDDCDIRVGGTAAMWSQMGHAVKFVACTNGDAGHPVMGGAPLARRRRAESA